MALKLNNTLYFIQMTNYLMITRFAKDDIWNMNQRTKHLLSKYSEGCKRYKQGKTVLGSDLLNDVFEVYFSPSMSQLI